MAIRTEIYERDGFPRATATMDDASGRVSVVVDHIEGLAPTRVVAAEETAKGIDSLDPPTVHGYTARDVITRAQYAVTEAVDSTAGPLIPPQILFTRYRTAVSVKGALAALGLDV